MDYEKRKQLYEQIFYRDEEVWSKKPKALYDADFWYNQNRLEISRELIKDLGKSIADIGCGDGDFLSLLNEYHTRVGVDISEKRINKAKNRFPNIEFKLGDCYNIELEDKSFDIVSALELLEHLEYPHKLMEELSRVSKKYILISTPNGNFLPIDGIEHLQSFSPFSLMDFLNRLGFTIIKKCGNVPLIFNLLLKKPELLPLYKEMAIDYHKKELSYYICTQMIVLLKKE